MPIYQYKCSDCGHQLDALQKLSDPQLVDCPACGAAALSKQLTAAAFSLKGTGWYATDFKNSDSKSSATAAAAQDPATDSDKSSEAKNETQGDAGASS